MIAAGLSLAVAALVLGVVLLVLGVARAFYFRGYGAGWRTGAGLERRWSEEDRALEHELRRDPETGALGYPEVRP